MTVDFDHCCFPELGAFSILDVKLLIIHLAEDAGLSIALADFILSFGDKRQEQSPRLRAETHVLSHPSTASSFALSPTETQLP